MNRLLLRLFALCVLSAGVFFVTEQPNYASEECSTCEMNYYNCNEQCPTFPNYDKPCVGACRQTLRSCSVGCTPGGMPYNPACPSSGACAAFYSNCDTNCVADRDLCNAECPSGDTSCYNVCQSNANVCRAFCQAEFYDCAWCD